MNYKNIFENLKTVRDFKKTTVDNKIIEEIKSFAKDIVLPKESSFEIVTINGEEIYSKLSEKIGYFGKIIEAPLYLAVVGSEDSSLVDAGYFTEAIRLKIQDLGLGSCWISIKDNTTMFLGEKKVATVLAVGEIYNGIFKKDIQTKSERNSISDIVFDKKWNKEITLEELSNLGLEEVFYFTRFAPSWGNKQPWKFIVSESKIYLLIEEDENKSFDLETGIVSLFLEKAFIAVGIPVNGTYEESTIDLGQPENYKIRAIFTL